MTQRAELLGSQTTGFYFVVLCPAGVPEAIAGEPFIELDDALAWLAQIRADDQLPASGSLDPYTIAKMSWWDRS